MIRDFILDGLTVCKHLRILKKKKPQQACLAFDKRLFLPHTKITDRTSKLLLLKLSVKIAYFKLTKTALNEKKMSLPGNKVRHQDFFSSLYQMDAVSITSLTLLR